MSDDDESLRYLPVPPTQPPSPTNRTTIQIMEATAVIDGPSSILRPNIQMDDMDQKLERVLGSLIDYRVQKRLIIIPNGRDKLGQGGYGDVWLGVQTLENVSGAEEGSAATREVAVKTLRQTTQQTKQERTLTACQLARELKVWAGLLHRNILELVGFYLSETLDDAWLLSPYEPRGNLATFLEKEKPSQGGKLELVFDVVCGLRYLHSHRPTVIHGDLKPENIIVGRDGFAKLCDFGLAKAPEEPTGLTNAGPVQGTTRYMSPELVDEEDATATVASDIWAFACVAGEVFTGHAPYHWVKSQSRIILQVAKGKVPIPLGPFSLPSELEEWIMTCWNPEPCGRPSVLDCVDNLKRHMAATFPDSARLLQTNDASLAAIPSQTDDFFVELHREKLRKQTALHPEYATTLTNLAFTLTERFEAEKKPADINEAVTLHRQALGLRLQGSPERQSTLIALGVALFKQFQISDDTQNLDEMVMVFREALDMGPPNHPDRSLHLANLAVVLSLSSKRTLDRGVSDECISLYREAAELQSVEYPDPLPRLKNLAGALQERFETFGGAKDLEEAIELRQKILRLQAIGDSDRGQAIERLFWVLISRSDTYGDPADRTPSVELGREALKLRPVGHPDRSDILNGLSWALHQRFKSLGDDRDLDEALALMREGVKLAEAPDLYLMTGLACALRTRFDRYGDPQDISEALDLIRESTRLWHTAHHGRTNSEIAMHFGNILAYNFRRSGDANEINEAIELLRKALQMCPGRHAYRYNRLLALGRSLRFRGGPGDMVEAKKLHSEALDLVPGDSPGNLRRQVKVKQRLEELEAAMLAAENDGSVDVRQKMEAVDLKRE